MGSTNDGTSCRLLKIDRSPPNPANPRLNVVDTDTEYSEEEIKDVCVCVCVCVCLCLLMHARVYVCVFALQLLIMLDDGNKYAANKFKSQHGLKQVASAFGIIGE